MSRVIASTSDYPFFILLYGNSLLSQVIGRFISTVKPPSGAFVAATVPWCRLTARDSYVSAQKKVSVKDANGQKLTGTDFQSNRPGATR